MRKDRLDKSFRTWEYAALVAEIMERMTGDDCRVECDDGYLFVVRNVGDRWAQV